MTQEEIATATLIAEFMELELAGPGFPSGYFREDIYYHFEDLKYHTSWDWLMSVVEKIEEIGFDVDIYKHPNGQQVCIIHPPYSEDSNIQASELADEVTGNRMAIEERSQSKKQAVYNTAVGFIQWYNNQSKNMERENFITELKQNANILVADSDSIEYNRGVCELIAYMDGLPGVGSGDRAIQIGKELHIYRPERMYPIN